MMEQWILEVYGSLLILSQYNNCTLLHLHNIIRLILILHVLDTCVTHYSCKYCTILETWT